MRPNSASSLCVLFLSSLVNAPRLAIAVSTLPNRAAKVVVLPCTRSVNCAKVMLASCAAFLMFITDFPKPAPCCDRVLNMLALKSMLFPSICIGCRAVPANSFVAEVKSCTPEVASMKFMIVRGTARAVSKAILPIDLIRPAPASLIFVPKSLVALVEFFVAFISASMALISLGLRSLLIFSSSFSNRM